MPLYEIDGVAPTLGAKAWAAPSADLIGDVRLGAGASIRSMNSESFAPMFAALAAGAAKAIGATARQKRNRFVMAQEWPGHG